MVDRLVQGGAGDQIAGIQTIAEEDLLFSKAYGSSIFAAGLDDGRTLTVHRQGGKRVGIRFPAGENLVAGSEDIALIRDRQGLVTARFSLGEAPEGFTPLAQEEMPQTPSGSVDLVFNSREPSSD
jgi:hypothetical protein